MELTEPLPDEMLQKKIGLGAIMNDFADGVSFCVAKKCDLHHRHLL
jgi:hypothetical protein